MDLDIEDLIIPQEPIVVKRILIKVANITFNESVTFFIYFYPNLKMDTVTIEGDEYRQWNNDDNYIINL